MAAPLLIRAGAWLAPRATARWLAGRQAADTLIRQRYEGARLDRGVSDWRPWTTTADAEIGRDIVVLRARARDLARNSSLAAKAQQELVDAIVGEGLRPMPMTGNRPLNRRISELWMRWAETCDLTGNHTFDSMTALAVRETIEAGDCFARIHTLQPHDTTEDPTSIPLRLEVIEAERLAVGMTGLPGASQRLRRLRDGIEYDDNGRPATYYFNLFDEGSLGSWHQDASTDASGVGVGQYGATAVPAEQVMHLFERLRVQSRGVPWAAPAMRDLRDLDDWQQAELLRKKLEACQVGVVINDDGDRPGLSANTSLTDSRGNPMEALEPGTIAYAAGTRDIRFNAPAPVAGIAEWLRAQLHLIAAGWRIPYALLTGDLSQANFASSRVAIHSYRRMVTTFQRHHLVPCWCAPIWRRFIQHAELSGQLELPMELQARVPVKWIPPKFESVDPLKDVQSDVLEVRAGFTSLAQQIARRGSDPDDLLAEVERTNEQVDELELVFDSDPRRTNKAGGGQSVSVDDDDDEQMAMPQPGQNPFEDGDGDDDDEDDREPEPEQMEQDDG